MPRKPKAPKLTRLESARLLYSRVADWQPAERGPDKRPAFLIPSRSEAGVYRRATSNQCDCPNFSIPASKGNGALACAHMLAVQIFEHEALAHVRRLLGKR